MIKKIIDWFKQIIQLFNQIKEAGEKNQKTQEIKKKDDPAAPKQIKPKPKKSPPKETFEVFPKILYGVNVNDKIPGAPNFTYAELLRSETAKRKKIRNVPGKHEFQNLILTARRVLQPIRNEFGKVIVTSGYRCPELCIAVGSTVNSNHTRGEAVDFFVPSTPLFDVVKWIVKNLEFRELILEYSNKKSKKTPLIIHVAYRKNGNIGVIKHPETYKPITLNALKEYVEDHK